METPIINIRTLFGEHRSNWDKMLKLTFSEWASPQGGVKETESGDF